MHVIVVNNIYPPIMAGGAELMVAWLSEGLVQRGHEVTVVSTCGPDMEPYPVEHRNGVTVIRFFPHNVYWNFARDTEKRHRRLLWHLRDAWNRDAGAKFRALLGHAPPDIVHTHLLDGFSATVWRRARQAGVPIVHTAHDYHLLCPRAFLLTRDWRICSHPSLPCRAYRTWHLHTTADVDLFVSPSDFLLQRHMQAGLKARATAVVRNGVPLPKRADEIRTQRRRDAAPRRFLLLTRLTVEKGVRVVVQAVSALPRDLDFELIIAGRGQLEPEMRAAATADPRIRFAGYVTGEEKEELLAWADYLLVPSLWYENAPVAVIEAAAYGLGVIASRIGGLPELVRDGRTGFLFEPGDADGLSTIIRRLLLGEVALPALDTELLAVRQDHTVDRMVDAYLARYFDVLRSRGHATPLVSQVAHAA